jgi:hypothetical protein
MTPEERRANTIQAEHDYEDMQRAHFEGNHDERPLLDDCGGCKIAFSKAYAEHAWMGRAVKTWTGGNPYAPADNDGYDREKEGGEG